MNENVKGVIASYIQAMDTIVQGESEMPYESLYELPILEGICIALGFRGVNEVPEVLDNGVFDDVWRIIEMERGLKCVGIDNKTYSGNKKNLDQWIVQYSSESDRGHELNYHRGR